MTISGAKPFLHLSLRGARQGDVAISTRATRRLLRLRLAMTYRWRKRFLGEFILRSPRPNGVGSETERLEMHNWERFPVLVIARSPSGRRGNLSTSNEEIASPAARNDIIGSYSDITWSLPAERWAGEASAVLQRRAARSARHALPLYHPMGIRSRQNTSTARALCRMKLPGPPVSPFEPQT